MKIVRTLGCIIALAVLTGTDAFACSCANTSGDVLFQRADAVFAGRVVGVEGDKITFEVEKSWKYVRSGQVAVYDTGKESCRSVFRVGDRMIIHASVKDDSLSTSVCMGFGNPDDPGPRFANLESRVQLPIDRGADVSHSGSVKGDVRPAEGAQLIGVIVIACAVLMVLVGIFLLVKRGGGSAA